MWGRAGAHSGSASVVSAFSSPLLAPGFAWRPSFRGRRCYTHLPPGGLALGVRLFFISGASGASAKSSRPKPPRPPGILRTPTRQYTRGRRLSCPSPRTPRENCAYVPARTQTRAAPFQSCAMCVCPVLAPHGRPAPPAPATRLSHHQTQAHDHSRRDARAAVHLSLQSAPIAQAPAPSSGTIPHRSATRPARRFTARRARRHAARAGHRARSPLPEQGCCAVCMQTAQQPCLF